MSSWVLPYIKTDLFVHQDNADLVARLFYGITPLNWNYTAEVDYFANTNHNDMKMKKDGYFSGVCGKHCIEEVMDIETVNGISARDVFVNWYLENG